MAVKDKMISNEVLKPVYDNLNGKIGDLKSAFDTLPYKNIYDPADNTDDYYISQGSGAVVNSVGWNISDYFPVTSDSECYYKGISTPGGSPYSAYYKSDKTVISTFKQATGTNVMAGIPSNCAYVRFSIHDNDLNTFEFYLKELATVDDVKTVQSDIDSVEADVSENSAQIIELQSKSVAGLEACREGNFGQKITATGTTTNGFWNVDTGTFTSSDNFRTLTVDVEGGVLGYYYTGVVYNVAFVSGAVYLDVGNNIIGTELLGSTSGIKTYSDYHLQSIPNGTTKIAFGSYVGGGGAIGAKKWACAGDVYSQLDFVVTGDSIETEAAGLWPVMLKNLIGFKSYTNKAVGGTCMAAVGDNYISSDARISAMPATADIVLVGGGTNDWGNNVVLGSLDDLTSNANFAGAVYSMIGKLQTKYPNALIVFVSAQNTCSPNRHDFDDPNGWVNNYGKSAADYADMMEKVCKFAGIPYIDVNHECAINRLNYTSFLLQETNYYNDTVYMHPNEAGAKRMLRVIYRWFVNNKPVV